MAATLSINSRSAAFASGVTVFDAAESLGVAVPSSCRKQGKCRECLVEICHGMELLSPRTPEELPLQGGFRLACRSTIAASDGRIDGRLLRRGGLRIEDSARNLPGGDASRVPLDPPVVRDGDRILRDGAEIARDAGPLHGVAIDVGTTTVVVRAHDLETGALLATVAFENPQRFGGTDVLARVQFDTDNPGRLLQRTLLGYVARAVRELPVVPTSIFEYAVAGNSTMRDLFFGLDVRPIGQRPYRSTTEQELRDGRRATTALDAPAAALRLPGHPAARVYGLPLVSGHVGADAAATLLALEPHRSNRLVAIMDLGTNTELFLGHRGRLLCASCPAGPAFEGRGITCGMPAFDGAIARVRLGDSGEAHCKVIGDGPPAGLCGSGLVDLLAELFRTERINRFGRFEDGSNAFVADAAHRILLHESDINELAQAKAANVAGLQILLRQFGCVAADIECFYLAGGFGQHLDAVAARRIGLIPNLPDGRIVPVGNAAIEGTTRALLSVGRRRELEQLVASIRHVELESDPEFFDQFVSGCQFGPLDTPEEVSA